jgi:hypothetical protein
VKPTIDASNNNEEQYCPPENRPCQTLRLSQNSVKRHKL